MTQVVVVPSITQVVRGVGDFGVSRAADWDPQVSRGRSTVITRRRVGLIVPSSNTVVEEDFIHSVPAHMTIHSARMRLLETTEPALWTMIREHLPRAVEDIASVHPHVVVFADTSAGAILGQGAESKMIKDIADRTGARVVSTNEAVHASIASFNPRRIAVITPYIDSVNERIRRGLKERGFRLSKVAGMAQMDNFGFANILPERILTFAMHELTGIRFDLVFVSCTNLRALEIRQQLEDRLGVPVVTSNHATIQQTLQFVQTVSDHGIDAE